MFVSKKKLGRLQSMQHTKWHTYSERFTSHLMVYAEAKEVEMIQ